MTVKGVKSRAEFVGASPHFIEGDEFIVYIKDRILDPFCRDRTRDLLKSHDKIEQLGAIGLAHVRGVFKQEHPVEEIEDTRIKGRVLPLPFPHGLGDITPVPFLDACRRLRRSCTRGSRRSPP